MLKNQNGITLVALVITIIILIILATVTIVFAFSGGDSLIDRSEQAGEMYANDTKYTEDSISNVVAYIDEKLPQTTGA